MVRLSGSAAAIRCGPTVVLVVSATRVLVFGSSGLVASRLTDLPTRCSFAAPDQRVDITDRDAVQRCLDSERPDVVLNAAAYTDVTQAWREAGQIDGTCYRVNADGAENVAAACAAAGVRLLHVSTAYVFSGGSDEPYSETSCPDAATDWYSYTTRIGEERVLNSAPGSAVIRTDLPFRSGHVRPDVARSILDSLAAGRTVTRFDDIVSMPTYVDDICAAVDHLALVSDAGPFHVTNGRALSPYAFALLLARVWGYPSALVVASSHASYVDAGGRPYPERLALTSSRLEQTGFQMPTLRDAVERMHEAPTIA